MEIEIISQNSNDKLSSISLDPKVWASEFSPQLISLYNRYSLFNKRQTISKTKTKGEVAGGGRKPWKQKGTGRARQGSIRAPQWRGGGVVFGPTGEQNYGIDLNKKVRKSALSSLLSKKIVEKEVLVVDELNLKNYKTKEALSFLEGLKLADKKILLVLSYPSEFSIQVRKSFENLKNVHLTSASQINVLKILNTSFVVFTKEAVIEMEKRLS
ncbi:MAG: hypothetical protein AM1032_000232 [Mycoplasmataceae bacterium]|nr:MAG: hypothetical protein AM1032_000232 [Mycoplasmataceae bacterium]